MIYGIYGLYQYNMNSKFVYNGLITAGVNIIISLAAHQPRY